MKKSVFIMLVLVSGVIVGAISGFILIKSHGSFEESQDFTLVDIDGDTFRLSDYRGRVVVLDFMATWCGPCRQEMTHLKEIASKYGGEDVVIISIDIDPGETDEMLREFKSSYGANWIFAIGPDVGVMYGVAAIPTICIIDRNGSLAYRSVGLTPASALLTEINKFL